jgi:hypothetical protein
VDPPDGVVGRIVKGEQFVFIEIAVGVDQLATESVEVWTTQIVHGNSPVRRVPEPGRQKRKYTMRVLQSERTHKRGAPPGDVALSAVHLHLQMLRRFKCACGRRDYGATRTRLSTGFWARIVALRRSILESVCCSSVGLSQRPMEGLGDLLFVGFATRSGSTMRFVAPKVSLLEGVGRCCKTGDLI